jgi:hypothetical protein
MRAALGLLCACALIRAAALAQTEDPKDLLLRVRANVEDTVKRLPKYVCTLTIERAQYAAQERHARSCDGLLTQRNKGGWHPGLDAIDRLRLDVGVAGTKEMFSWAGEDRFDDRDLFHLVGQGALQIGEFSGFLTSVFIGEDAEISYDGDTKVSGRALARFGFEVPVGKSHYVFRNRQGNREIVTGYEGYFLADPSTGDLATLVIRTNSDVSDVGSSESATTLEYNRVRLNDSEFLLPREEHLDILNLNGSDFTNHTTYANCREFLGESVLRFDLPLPGPGASAANAPGSSSKQLPPKLYFRLVFTQDIDTGTAAAGDRIKAKLSSAIRDASSKEILVPSGADVVARIRRLKYFPGPPSSNGEVSSFFVSHPRGSPQDPRLSVCICG